MLYFFDAVLGLDRIRDPEGSEFPDVEAAMAEAGKTAAEISIEELRRGSRVGADWRIEILDTSRSVLASVLFYEVLLEPVADMHIARMMRRHFLGSPDLLPAYQRSRAALEDSRAIAENVRAVFSEMKQRLDALS
ncbi:MAG: hypothetical protein JSR99_15165 [Proteobacteria bacterium]|nr:hypothetical protein [Pseudomonadota bacterium]